MTLFPGNFAGGTSLSGFIPVRAFAMRTYLGFLVFFTRHPLVVAPLASVTPNLDLRHMDHLNYDTS